MEAKISAFSHEKYLFRQKVLTYENERRILVYDPNGQIVLCSKTDPASVKEETKVYKDETMSNEWLTIKKRRVVDVDIGATYDVFDHVHGITIGAVRRKGVRLTPREQWLFLDPEGEEICILQEDNIAPIGLPLRLLGIKLPPRKFSVTVGRQTLATVREHFNPLITKYTLDLSKDYNRMLDRRLCIAACILLC
ncbi:hypothetical protein ACFLX5_02340 [Chloroflexota bacterium]